MKLSRWVIKPKAGRWGVQMIPGVSGKTHLPYVQIPPPLIGELGVVVIRSVIDLS